MKKEQIKKLLLDEKKTGHKFIKHAEDCNCPICQGNIRICSVCGGSATGPFTSLTTMCSGESLEPSRLDEINQGVYDFDDKGWFKVNEHNAVAVRDVVDYKIGTTIKSNQGVEFIVFATYENNRGKRGIRLVETNNYMNANPEMRSYIFAESMAPWFPSFAKLLDEYNESNAL